jgi:hypothetical protein
MARMLGRIAAGRCCYCRDCGGPKGGSRRRKRQEKREVARQIADARRTASVTNRQTED